MLAQEIVSRFPEIPDDLKDQSNEYREKLIEKAVEEDDAIMEKYLENGKM